MLGLVVGVDWDSHPKGLYHGQGKRTLGIPGCSHFYLKVGTAVDAGGRLPSKGLPRHSNCSSHLGDTVIMKEYQVHSLSIVSHLNFEQLAFQSLLYAYLH